MAADDLDKATNQFESMRLSQEQDYSPTIQSNPEKFEQKALRARAALAAFRSGSSKEGQ